MDRATFRSGFALACLFLLLGVATRAFAEAPVQSSKHASVRASQVPAQVALPGPESAGNFIIKRISLPASKIQDLVWQGDVLEVQQRRKRDKVECYVNLEGTYSKPKYDLYVLNRLVTRAVSGAFSIKVACKSKPVQVSLRAVGPSGIAETEEILLLKMTKKNEAE